MSTLVERGNIDHSSRGQAALGFIVGIVRLVILWKEMRSARQLLQSMPDGVLSDMGISRGSIDHATAFGRTAAKGH